MFVKGFVIVEVLLLDICDKLVEMVCKGFYVDVWRGLICFSSFLVIGVEFVGVCWCLSMDEYWSILICFKSLLVNGIFICFCNLIEDECWIFVLLRKWDNWEEVLFVLVINGGKRIDIFLWFVVVFDDIWLFGLWILFLFFFGMFFIVVKERFKFFLFGIFKVELFCVVVLVVEWGVLWSKVFLWLKMFWILLSGNFIDIKLFVFFEVLEINIIIDWLSVLIWGIFGKLDFSVFKFLLIWWFW